MNLVTCLFYLPFLVIAPNRFTLENSSLFLWASLSRTMKRTVSAVSKFSTTVAWPGMLTGSGGSGVHHTLTKDAHPDLLAEGMQSLLFFSLRKQRGRMMERRDGPALHHTSLTELGDNAQ